MNTFGLFAKSALLVVGPPLFWDPFEPFQVCRQNVALKLAFISRVARDNLKKDSEPGDDYESNHYHHSLIVVILSVFYSSLANQVFTDVFVVPWVTIFYKRPISDQKSQRQSHFGDSMCVRLSTVP